MPQVGGHRLPGVLAVDRFTHEWAETLSGCFAGGANEAAVRLRPLAIELAELLRDEQRDSGLARALGDRLAEARVRGAHALPATLRLIRTRGRELLGLTAGVDRLGDLLEQFATGYAEGLRSRAGAEQETLLNAVLRTRQEAEDALRASEKRFRAIFTEAAVGIAIASLDGEVLDVNPALHRLFGDEQSTARPLTDQVHPEDAPALTEQFHELAAGRRESLRSDVRFVRPDGTVIFTYVTASLVRDDSGAPDYVIGVVEDVTERQQLRSRLRHQTYHDQLTRLPNRSLMDAQLRWAFSTGSTVRRVGLLHLDLDGFRAINDSLGHQVGDQLLLAVAGRLQQLANEHLVTRMGGDEFAILVTDPTGVEYLCGLAEDVLAGLAPPFVVGSRRLTVTASLGIAEHAVTGTWPGELQRAADTARSWAKAAGGGRWAVFDAERDAGETSQFALAASVSGAVDRDEFHLLYQPLVELSSGELTGVEALVRWKHPEQGLLGPAKFIELAERNGAIVPLGRWVLTEACRQARRWCDQFGPAAPYVSVNVAPRQLAEPSWLAEVESVLAGSGLDPDRLQLEITERAVLVDEETTSVTLRTLREMGVRLAIDDFGTGYSSLSYLRRLPVHGLKIDGSFIQGLTASGSEDSPDGKIVDALIKMAHALGLVVTAEWVETSAQARWLRSLGCDVGQGNWYGDPVPPAQLDRLLRRPLAG